MNKKIIEVKNLKKSYHELEAVKGIDLDVYEGKLFAFLGPNGAGKSTTINIITTTLKPTSGEIKVCGIDIDKHPEKVRSEIGIVFQNSVLDDILTVKENLYARGGLYCYSKEELKKSVEEAMMITGIEELANRPYKKLSGGQKRRVDIARALLNHPKVLFLDEPTTGLDPQTRKYIWKMIIKLQKETNMTIFLTTHYMEEASDADYVTIIDDGLIVAAGTPGELKEKYTYDIVKLYSKDIELITTYLDNNDYQYQIIGEQVKVKLATTKEAIKILTDLQQYLENFEVLNGTMDDVFINITGKEIRE